MNKSLILYLLIITISFGCNNGKQIITKAGDVKNLVNIIEEVKNQNQKITPEIALKSIIELYKSKQSFSKTNEKPIDLYFLYGTENSYKNKPNTFEMSFAHQFVDNSNGLLYEYRIDLIYDTAPFQRVHGVACTFQKDKNDLNSFEMMVRKSEGFQKALITNETEVYLTREKI